MFGFSTMSKLFEHIYSVVVERREQKVFENECAMITYVHIYTLSNAWLPYGHRKKKRDRVKTFVSVLLLLFCLIGHIRIWRHMHNCCLLARSLDRSFLSIPLTSISRSVKEKENERNQVYYDRLMKSR